MGGVKTKHLTNRSALKKYILLRWEYLRPGHRMSRVPDDTLDWIEANMKNYIDKMIKTHPSVGKTIKPY